MWEEGDDCEENGLRPRCKVVCGNDTEWADVA